MRSKPLNSFKEYNPETKVRGYVYDMDEYVGKNIARDLKDTRAKKKLKKVATPFLDESREPMGCTVAETQGGERSQEISIPTRLPKPTVNSQEVTDVKPPQQFNKVAAGISMQSMYAARMARHDTLRAVGNLATYLTECGRAEDEKLHRFISYLNSTKDLKQVGIVGDAPE